MTRKRARHGGGQEPQSNQCNQPCQSQSASSEWFRKASNDGNHQHRKAKATSSARK